MLVEDFYKADAKDIDKRLVTLLKFLNKLSLKAIDNLFSMLQEDRMPTIMIIAMLRYTFIIRNELQNWHDFLQRSIAECTKRNLDIDDLFQGLQRD